MYVRVPFGSFGQGKIVGGTPDPDAIKLSEEQQNAIGAFVRNGRVFCTATAIAPRVVVSAAHCSAVTRGTQFVVGRDLRSPVFSATVLDVARHPNFRGTSDADFLVAYLDHDVPAVLPLGRSPSVGEVVQTAGYGRTGVDETGNMLRWWLAEQVREVRAEDFAVFSGGQHGMCLGDSGGPALRMEDGHPAVVGTVSWGDQSCTGTDVFKRLDFAEEWIRATIASWELAPPSPISASAAIRQAGIGWLVGLLVVGAAVGLVVRARKA